MTPDELFQTHCGPAFTQIQNDVSAIKKVVCGNGRVGLYEQTNINTREIVEIKELLSEKKDDSKWLRRTVLAAVIVGLLFPIREVGQWLWELAGHAHP